MAVAQAAFIASSIRHATSPRTYPDTVALLESLHPICPVGLVTNNFRPVVTAVLSALPALDVFSVIATVDQAGMTPKPAPELHAYAIAQLGIPAADCVAIEDSDQGIEAALAAGSRCLDIHTFRPVTPS